jgi:hypothetical protein
MEKCGRDLRSNSRGINTVAVLWLLIAIVVLVVGILLIGAFLTVMLILIIVGIALVIHGPKPYGLILGFLLVIAGIVIIVLGLYAPAYFGAFGH